HPEVRLGSGVTQEPGHTRERRERAFAVTRDVLEAPLGSRVETDTHPGMGARHAVGNLRTFKPRTIGDKSDSQAHILRSVADLPVAGMEGALAAAAERHRPSAAGGKFA